jgi:hypothetical protein
MLFKLLKKAIPSYSALDAIDEVKIAEFCFVLCLEIDRKFGGVVSPRMLIR